MNIKKSAKLNNVAMEADREAEKRHNKSRKRWWFRKWYFGKLGLDSVIFVGRGRSDEWKFN